MKQARGRLNAGGDQRIGNDRARSRHPVAFADKALCADILGGKTTLETPGLLAGLRKLALAKLGNDVPKYAGLAKARAIWT